MRRTASAGPAALPWTALILAAVAALFFARMIVHVDPDVFFHLKEGGRVLTERRLPLAEEYSYTRAGKAMIATEWLSGAIFAGAFALGGYPAVAALGAALLAAALWLMTKVWDGGGAPEEARALLAALAAFGLLNFALAKVQNFTFFFFALDLYWARRWERGARWAPWAMAAVLLPWVNMHGGFILGWIVLGGVCAVECARTRRAASLAPWAAGTAACFVHPNGAAAFVYPVWFLFAAPAARSLIVEWRPLAPALSAAPYALVLAAALLSRVDRLRERLPWAFLGFVFLVLGLRTRKMLPYFVLVECAAAGLALSGARAGRGASRALAAAACAAVLMIGVVERAEARALSAYGPAFDWEREYPREAVERYIARDPGRRLFHPYDWGAYLLYKLPPGDKVFIDGRTDPYWTLMGDYRTLIAAAPGWRELAAAYGIEAALLPPGSPLAKALEAEPAWTRAGTDGRAVLFERRSPVPLLP